MKRRRIIVAAIAAGLVLAVFLGLHLRNRADERRYRAAVRELAEAGQLEQLIGPPVPETKAEQEELDRLTDKIGEVLPESLLKMEALVPLGTNRFEPAWSSPGLRLGSTGSYDWDELERKRLLVEEFVAGIRERLEQERARSWITLSNWDEAVPSFTHMRNRVRWMAVLAQSDLRRRENARAIGRIELMLGEAERFRDDGALVQTMIRAAMAGLALETVISSVGATGFSDTELARLQTALSRADWIVEIPKAVAKERANMVAWAGPLQAMSTRQRIKLLHGSNITWKDEVRGVLSGGYRAGMKQGEAAIRYVNQQVEVARAGVRTPEGLRGLVTDMDALMAQEDKLGLYAMAIPRYGNAIQSMIRLECLRRMALVRIALERFRLKHGRFPETLAEISVGLSGAEVDPLSGEPFRYRLGEDGRPLLHSVGMNGTDEGGAGDMIGRWKESADWPWPQVVPASAGAP